MTVTDPSTDQDVRTLSYDPGATLRVKVRVRPRLR